MRAYLILEDTPDGLTLEGKFIANGCTDHAADSLSTLVSIAFGSQLLAQHQKGTLRVKQIDCGGRGLCAPS